MDFGEFVLLLAGVAVTAMLLRRIGRLERELRGLHDRLDGRTEIAPTAPAVQPSRAPARIVTRDAPAQPQPPPPPAEAPPPYARPLGLSVPKFSIEDAIGGRLPIWIGGIALVLAGFFLVRYSIESGLIGPVARTVLAALFSLLLVAASEAARRLPLTRDDPRVGQVLAGAAVASAYGTLYIAAAQYHLVGPIPGFALMIAITAGALFLALRHGPPTAIMALAGGFVAPLVAGFDAAGVGPLLVYLALFAAALFGLAIRRGWTWLAVAALAAAFGWANLIIVLLDGRDAGLVAAFTVAIAIAGSLALPPAGADNRWLRLAPLVAGLIQLLVLAPVLAFSVTAWTFYLVLAAAALILAWRDPRMLPGALAAATLVLVLIAAALWQPERQVTPLAVAIATALFGGAGFALSRTAREWAIVAALGLAGPVVVTHAFAANLLAPIAWLLIELALAAAAFALALRHRDRAGTGDAGLVAGTAAAALLAGLGFAAWLPLSWASLPVAAVMIALALWSRRLADPGLARLPALALLGLVLLAFQPLTSLAGMTVQSLAGEELTYPWLPALGDIVLRLSIPALAGTAIMWRDSASFGRGRAAAGGVIALFAIAALYGLFKQPLHIADRARFIDWGFTERAAITLSFIGAGWLAWRGQLATLGNALAGIGLFRILWFDLLLLDPVAVAQHVGPAPVANMAVLLPALAALSLIHRLGIWRLVALALTALAAAAGVRQLARGSLLIGPIGSTENWGYSAAFLTLAIAWLWRGITTGSRTLRSAGLGLLTIVTLKVFLIDVAASGGLLRILALLGLGVALIGIGWGYRRVFPGGEVRTDAATTE